MDLASAVNYAEIIGLHGLLSASANIMNDTTTEFNEHILSTRIGSDEKVITTRPFSINMVVTARYKPSF